MNQLKVGFARVDITPPMGINLCGYLFARYADGVLDPLNLRALALQVGENKVVLLSAELVGLNQEIALQIRNRIAEKIGLSAKAIYLHCSHTHTGPELLLNLAGCPDVQQVEMQENYIAQLCQKCVDASMLALADLQPAKMGYGVGEAPNVAFIRRYRMKNGSVQTNPGVNNPDIIAPVGDVDERVSVIRFDRDGGDSVVFVNFANHPDTIGGSKVSGDWPALLCDTVEKVLDNTKCIFFNGCQGDVNHVNVHPTGGYANGMRMDFDGPRAYSHSRYIARVIAGGVLQAFDKVKYVEADKLRFDQKMIKILANTPDSSEIAEAQEYHRLHAAGRDDLIPYTGMMLTTVVAKAERILRLKDGPESFDLLLSAVSVGDVALIGIAGEPFTGVGRVLKKTPGWEFVVPTCLTNGCQGYFPMRECYEEGGYEADSSSFKAGVAEQIIAECQDLLAALRKG